MKTDPPHILCVNPWIHDFAAFDFWAAPLGLLSIAAILRKAGVRVSYLNCLDRFHPNEPRPVKTLWDGRGPYRKTPLDFDSVLAPFVGDTSRLPRVRQAFSRYGVLPQWFIRDLETMDRPDLIFVTSIMAYWASGAAETIQAIKSVYPNVPVVLGGIYASLCHEHALAHSGADRVMAGPVENDLSHMIETFTGFKIDLPVDPGCLDTYPFAALDLQSQIPFAPILTSRGCPFSCEYCASSFLEPKMRRRSPDHVFKEIIYWHQTRGVKNFAFYDDALLINSKAYAYPLLEKIIDSGVDLMFHTPNALHIREITPKAARLMFQAGFKTIRLGLETTDFSENRTHDAKVKKDEFARAVKALREAGFETKQIGAYLLCGLPGQRICEIKSAMDLVRQSGITPVQAFYTPIPHTPMWEEAVAHARFDIRLHPALTNNTLFPCVASEDDIKRIYQLKNMRKRL